jgi:hypothetical protein
MHWCFGSSNQSSDRSRNKKAGFLESVHQAELMSVVVGVRTAMKQKVVTKSFSANDMKLVEQFVSQPDAFASMHSAGMSATQIGQNPFGDYAPQSTQIQGILKGMYDAFTTLCLTHVWG